MARSEMGFGQRTLVFCRPLPPPIGPVANSSAMRVCQPGPLARHRSITSGGSRRLISCRGLADGGRPRFRTTARASMASVSSGSSSYSCGLITCASTRLRSEPEKRREAGLFTIVGRGVVIEFENWVAGGDAQATYRALSSAEMRGLRSAITRPWRINAKPPAPPRALCPKSSEAPLPHRLGSACLVPSFGSCPEKHQSASQTRPG